MIKKAIVSEQKLLIIILVLTVISLVLAIIQITLLYQQTGRKVLPTPTPTPSLAPITVRIATPSAYATDSAILEIKTNLETIETDLRETDIRETGLHPPVLDMEVEFEE